MKMKSILLLAVALGCGLVAMLGVQQVMSGPAPTEQKAPETKKVLVASKEIQPFSLLDDSNTTFKAMAIKDVPDGAITSRSEYAESRLRYFAAKGDVIQVSKLADKNYAPSQEIAPGMRVVTVKVNQTKTHSGLIRPSDHVDVVLTYKSAKPGQPTRQRTVTVLRNVKVFSIDDKRLSNSKDADGNELKAKNISLMVTPAHGNLLMLAENRGVLTLALRHKGDKESADQPKVAVDDTIFDNLERAAESKSAPKTEDGGFKNFLTAGQDKPVETQNTKAGPSAKPKWKLTIYDGKTPRIEEVELPEASESKKKSPSNDQNG